MPFADIEVKFNQPFEKAKRTEFMTTSQGAHTIRILNEQAKTQPTHYFQNTKATVLCLGDECPICANNKKLIMQFPEDFRKQAGYNKINYRFFVNVLDKTPAKVCECGKEWKDLSLTVCTTCGKVLPQAAPLNKVKVLSKGLTLRDDIASVEKAILDASGTPIPLTTYDYMLMVSGTGRDTKITPVPRPDANQPTPEGLELYDLEKITIVLDPSEMLEVSRGVSIRDIFSARRGKEDKKYSAEFMGETIADQASLDEAAEAVNSLFNK